METKKMQKILRRLGAFAMAAAMLLSLLPAGVLKVTAVVTGKWTDSGNYTSADLTVASTGTTAGTEGNPYLITSAQDLAKLAQNATLAKGNKFFKLTANIDLSAHEWVPVAEFKGTLDGNGKTITGLTIGTASSPTGLVNGGFIATLSSGVVMNLSVQVAIYTTGKKRNCRF